MRTSPAQLRSRRGTALVTLGGLLALSGLALFGAAIGAASQGTAKRQLDADRFARIEQQQGTSFPDGFALGSGAGVVAPRDDAVDGASTPPPDRSTVELLPPAPTASPTPVAARLATLALVPGVGLDAGPTDAAAGATAPSVATPTPAPTPSPDMPAPTHISIPAVGVDTDVVEVTSATIAVGDQSALKWNVADYAAGHHDTSANPGEGGNIVLAGHDDYRGEVFHGLHDIEIGDQITVTTPAGQFVYVVREVHLRRYNDAPLADQLAVGVWLAPMPEERLTLVTCWPYAVDNYRMIVVAKPLTDPVQIDEALP